jgi:F-type H+-transporting ATPase subunit gamma
MANTKEIQGRIKSINSTRKITKAMEMVAATKMRKAVEAVLQTRTYANLSWTTVLNLAQAVNSNHNEHPLLSKRERVIRVGIVLISSNRGLCGGFNSSLISKVHDSILKHDKNIDKQKIENEIIVVGKKGLSVYNRYGYNVVAEFPKLDICSESVEVRPIARLIIDSFLDRKYDKVMVAYTDYVSASKQESRIKQILPIDLDAKDDHLGVVGGDTRLGADKKYIKSKEDKYLKDKNKKNVYVFTYEPNAREVLDEMLPRLIEIQLYQALLESNASEHSARMAAMHQANEAAGDLVEELTLFYNKARQASITAEIAEISAGASALEN